MNVKFTPDGFEFDGNAKELVELIKYLSLTEQTESLQDLHLYVSNGDKEELPDWLPDVDDVNDKWYCAVDRDGEIYTYEVRPRKDENMWYTQSPKPRRVGWLFGWLGGTYDDWDKHLYQVVDGEWKRRTV